MHYTPEPGTLSKETTVSLKSTSAATQMEGGCYCLMMYVDDVLVVHGGVYVFVSVVVVDDADDAGHAHGDVYICGVLCVVDVLNVVGMIVDCVVVVVVRGGRSTRLRSRMPNACDYINGTTRHPTSTHAIAT